MKILCGDSLHLLKTLAPNSIDLIVTDPPYGYSFMGKDWDKAVPSVEMWKECLRVLKPGAFAFIMSAPRSDVLSRMIVRIEDAGFRVDFTPIYWTYASGFPKAMNIGKAVDKKLGNERLPTGIPQDEGVARWNKYRHGKYDNTETERTRGTSSLEGSYGGFQPKPAVEVIIVAMKPLSEKTYVDQALNNGKGVTWLDDARIPTNENNGRPQGSMPQPMDWGKSTGLVTEGDSRGRFPANLLVSDDVLNDGRVTKSTGRNGSDMGANLDPSKEGWRFTRAASSIHDTGSYSRYFSLDRWWTEAEKKLPERVRKVLPFLIVPKAGKREKNEGLGGTCTVKYNTGICPEENKLVLTLLEKVTCDIPAVSWLIDESGENITALCPSDFSSTIKTTISKTTILQTLNSLTRSLTSASTPVANFEKENGGSLAATVASLREWLLITTNGKMELARGVSDAAYKTLLAISENDVWQERRNIHSTVKPIQLLAYLITLGSRPGDTVLDPFLGSGTTAVAAKMLGRQCVGMEREEDYWRIARARIDATEEPPPTLFTEAAE